MNNINKLLEKYWNAETNLQEEADLRNYFASEDVADEHSQYSDMFTHIVLTQNTSSNLNINELFDSLENIDTLISKYWNAESTLEEEKILKAYFAADVVNKKYSEHIAYFNYLDRASKLTTDIEFTLPNTDQNLNIDTLLSKYWDAETSREEEERLKSYFMNDEVAEKHLEYKSLFTYFDSVSKMKTSIEIRTLFEKESSDIDLLLEKYFEASTSLEEEVILADYFKSNNLAAKHEAYKDLFVFYNNQKEASSTINLREVFEAQQTDSGNTISDDAPQPKEGKAKVINIRKLVSAIAAIFVLGFATISVMDQSINEQKTQYRGKYVKLDEAAEAQEAYEITMQAFALLSKNMNQGSSTVNKSVKKVKKASIFK